MELFQELVFTISFSLIVSLLIAKLFAVASSSDDGKSTTVPTRVDEKIEKEWVVCDSEKVGCFDDPVEVSEEGGFGDDLGSGVVIKDVGSVGDCYVFDEMPERIGVDDGAVGLVGSDEDESSAVVGGDCYVFDEMLERTEGNDAGVDLVESGEANVVESSVLLMQEDCVKSVEVQDGSAVEIVGDCYVFDEMPERTEVNDAGIGLVESGEGNVVEASGSVIQEDCVKSVDVQHESSAVVVGKCYVFDETPERTEGNDARVDLVESDAGYVVESSVALIQENCVESVEVQHASSPAIVSDSYVFDEMPERTEVNDAGVDSVERDEDDIVETNVLLIQEDCVKPVEVQHESCVVGVGEGKVDDKDEVFDDDWQGIETTELEKRFGAAVAFMGSKSSADRVNLIDNEVKVELYGLHKVAIEGSCFEPQPMALKVSARANWNSWKRLENLGREDAMEQYIALLSQHVPDWIGRHASDK